MRYESFDTRTAALSRLAEHRANGPQASLDVGALPGGLYVIEVADWGWRQRLIVR